MIRQPWAMFVCGGLVAYIGLLLYAASERRR